jgi:hypothetical protein
MTPELVNQLEKGEDEMLFYLWLHLPNESEDLLYFTINQQAKTINCWPKYATLEVLATRWLQSQKPDKSQIVANDMFNNGPVFQYI